MAAPARTDMQDGILKKRAVTQPSLTMQESKVNKENVKPSSAKKPKCWPACICSKFSFNGHEYTIKDRFQNSTGSQWTGKYVCSHFRVKSNKCNATLRMKVDKNGNQEITIGSHKHSCKQNAKANCSFHRFC